MPARTTKKRTKVVSFLFSDFLTLIFAQHWGTHRPAFVMCKNQDMEITK
jgi:hypothetical protein